jgi:hypothetical protein
MSLGLVQVYGQQQQSQNMRLHFALVEQTCLVSGFMIFGGAFGGQSKHLIKQMECLPKEIKMASC